MGQVRFSNARKVPCQLNKQSATSQKIKKMKFERWLFGDMVDRHSSETFVANLVGGFRDFIDEEMPSIGLLHDISSPVNA